jgi:hypothetical protein
MKLAVDINDCSDKTENDKTLIHVKKKNKN